MARLLRFFTSGPVAILLVGVALVFPASALAGPMFLLGVPDPCPDCDTVTFDDGGITTGTVVTTQFAAQGVTFENVRFMDGRLGQNSAPGFSGSGLVNDSAYEIVIHFANPMVFAAFAYADSGWDPCCQPRTLSAYWGSQLVASTDLPLQPAQFFTIPATYPGWKAAESAYSLAADKAAASNSAVEIQSAKVTADQANFDAAQANFIAAFNEYLLDYAKWVSCTSYYLICDAIYLPFVIADLVALSDAADRANATEAQLQADQAQLAALQAQRQVDQDALAIALNDLTAAGALYARALTDGPGPGFIGFQGDFFNTLVLSGLGAYCCDFNFTTAIDTLEMMPVPVRVPEPSTVTLLGAALTALAYLRRTRRGVMAVG